MHFMASKPADIAQRLEAHTTTRAGIEEHFSGYGIMGLPFASGHILALRRFPASSIGPGYSSVWHRKPAGDWTFYSDVDPGLSCSRFFGNAVATSIRCEISLTWTAADTLSITVPAANLSWTLRLANPPAVRMLNAMARVLPAPLWRQPAALVTMATTAERLLGVGRLQLFGCSPNGQRFRAAPDVLWIVEESHATLDGAALGSPGPVSPQARLGDFLIPQRGLFVFGSAFFEPGHGRCTQPGTGSFSSRARPVAPSHLWPMCRWSLPGSKT